MARNMLISSMMMLLGSHFLELILCSNSSINSSISIPLTERQALFDLYYFTAGYKWKQDSHRPQWNFDDPTINPCDNDRTWQGLTCTNNIKDKMMSHVIEISLTAYNLRGYLSETIGDLIYLDQLILANNNLNGTLPNSIYKLSSLVTLNINNNNFNGTLSHSIGELSQLQNLALRLNEFTGTIPSSIAALTQLKNLVISYNHFTGTLPSNAILSQLVVLNVARNNFNGTIPCGLSSASSLITLFTATNSFTGTIPQCWKAATKMLVFIISENKMSGSIPSFITEWSLRFFGISVNKFTGTLPYLGNMINLLTLYAYENLFTGTIPDMFSRLSLAYDLRLNDNAFTGSLPQSLSSLQKLKVFFVQNNKLSGSLTNLFHSTHLTFLQLSNNHFSGKLPEEVFALQHNNLTVFSAVSNCFRGTLPAIICNASSLKTLALDGMYAPSCPSKPNYLHRYIYGSIPACIYNMSALSTLHLSGNGFTGSLPDTKLGVNLLDLSLSHNLLDGTIPSDIQSRHWTNLDLSGNRFRGTLNNDFSDDTLNNSPYKLNRNRLSGKIPSVMRDMKNITVLQGNYFTCNFDRKDLPRNDVPENDRFQCGSNTFEVMYYIWLGMLFSPIMMLLLLWLFRGSIGRYVDVTSIVNTIRKYWNVKPYINQYRDTSFMQNFRNYLNFNDQIVKFTLLSSSYTIIILLPTYAVLGSYIGSTVSYKYAWLYSIAFQSGRISFNILMTLLVLFTAALVPVCESFFVNDDDIILSRSSNSSMSLHYDPRKDEGSYRKLQRIWYLYLLFLFASIIFMIGVNVSYVFAILYGNTAIILLAQIVVSGLKSCWTHVIFPMMSRRMIYFSSALNIPTKDSSRSLFLLQYCVIIFVNIIIPCAVLAVESPKCFYYLFIKESAVKSSFVYKFCILFSYPDAKECITYEPRTEITSYYPPFFYSYECSIDLIRTYSTVYIFICIISTFINPIAQIILSNNISTIFPQTHHISEERNIKYPIIDVNQKVLIDLSFVALLLTFGVVFPPLAVVTMVCIVVRNLIIRIYVGKVIIDSIDNDDDIKLDIIEEECGDLPPLRDICSYGWIIIFIASGFFSFILFDVLGDVEGLGSSYWVLIVMPLLPFFLYGCFRLKDRYVASQKTTPPPLVFDDSMEIDMNMRSNEAAAVVGPTSNFDDGADTTAFTVGLEHANFISDYDFSLNVPLYGSNKLSKQFSLVCNYGESEDDDDENSVNNSSSKLRRDRSKNFSPLDSMMEVCEDECEDDFSHSNKGRDNDDSNSQSLHNLSSKLHNDKDDSISWSNITTTDDSLKVRGGGSGKK